jgi:hypothetical protein
MFTCNVCQKVKVPDNGFIAFVEHNVLSILDLENEDRERIETWGQCRTQIRICPKCLKKKMPTIKI